MKPELSAFIAFPAQSCTLVSHHRPHRKILRFGDGGFGRIRWIFPNRGRQDCLQEQGCRPHLTCCVDSTHKPGRLPQEPHPPRRAHDTLQPPDESRPAYFNTKYFWYFMLKSKGDFSVFSNGSTFEAITTENLLNFPCVVPGIQEQQAIADFLDKECAQIDSIATDLEKQIALLQQYKKALITETVSKGLDKSVPVKDSGIEWIGEIPAHWDVEPIKYRVTFHNGDRGENYPTKSELQSEGIPFINAGHLEGDGLNMDNMDYISEEKYRIMGGVKLRSGDILYCLRGSVGKNAIVDMNQGTVASSLVAIRSVRISAEYLYYCLNSHIEEVQRYWWDNGTAQPNLSADNLGKYKICIPPVEEQKAIVKYLNNICSQIDNLIIGKKKQFSTIQQHKKSLIYEYVTGKKRVKEAQ